jgi:hypothetical protein
MILGLEIGMIIYGLIALMTGKFIVTKVRVVTGKLARQLGFILLMPIPIAYTAHGLVHYRFVRDRRPVGADSTFVWTMIAVEAGIVICCFATAYAIGWFATSYPKVFEESEPAPDVQAPAPIGITSLGNSFFSKPDGVTETTGPTLVCSACSRSIRLDADGRKTPWCPACGANL